MRIGVNAEVGLVWSVWLIRGICWREGWAVHRGRTYQVHVSVDVLWANELAGIFIWRSMARNRLQRGLFLLWL